MPVRRKSNVAYYVTIISIILFWGCSVEQTHKTLTFFFDGVDKTVFYNTYLSTDSISKDAIARREGLLKKVRPELCVHKPFKEKLCEKCHTPDKKLLMPMPALCYQCHRNFTETYANVHGPVASGNCTRCHNQHSSKYDKLLTRQGQAVCTYCHTASAVFAKKVHRDIEDVACTLCHNPHGSSNRFFVKSNISHDANRIALMSALTSRHLYAQIFCKEPGDINSSMEIRIYNSLGTLVSTSHPDNDGKFILTNLHPDENYTFRFKNTNADCKINVMDTKGTLLYVIEKKKGKYTFDKAAYEAAHDAVNAAIENAGYLDDATVVVNEDQVHHKDTGKSKMVVVEDNQAGVINSAEKPVSKEQWLSDEKQDEKPTGLQAEPKADTVIPAGAKQPKVKHTGRRADTTAPRRKPKVKGQQPKAQVENEKKGNAGPYYADTSLHKGKIKVTELFGHETAEETAAKNRNANRKEAQSVQPVDTTTYKGKIVIKSLPDMDNPTGLDQSSGRAARLQKYERNHTSLVDLATEVSRLYDGTTVCVLNDSAEYIDIAQVNKRGRFLLFDFLGYAINLPDSSSGIVSQTVFLNDKMELIDVINRRVNNGRYVFVCNSKETADRKVNIKLHADKDNASLFTTIYYEQAKVMISKVGITELDKVVSYLKDHPRARVLLAAHTDVRGAAGYNQRLSEDRAKAAADYLQSQGISKRRISVKGYGKSKPLSEPGALQAKDEANQRNRRVEVYLKEN